MESNLAMLVDPLSRLGREGGVDLKRLFPSIEQVEARETGRDKVGLTAADGPGSEVAAQLPLAFHSDQAKEATVPRQIDARAWPELQPGEPKKLPRLLGQGRLLPGAVFLPGGHALSPNISVQVIERHGVKASALEGQVPAQAAVCIVLRVGVALPLGEDVPVGGLLRLEDTETGAQGVDEAIAQEDDVAGPGLDFVEVRPHGRDILVLHPLAEAGFPHVLFPADPGLGAWPRANHDPALVLSKGAFQVLPCKLGGRMPVDGNVGAVSDIKYLHQDPQLGPIFFVVLLPQGLDGKSLQELGDERDASVGQANAADPLVHGILPAWSDRAVRGEYPLLRAKVVLGVGLPHEISSKLSAAVK